jgi:hypothetical protein
MNISGILGQNMGYMAKMKVLNGGFEIQKELG